MRFFVTKFKHLFIFFLFLQNISVEVSGQVYFNELMCTNTSSYMDPYTFKYSDWFELKNDGIDEISLFGYFLTDNLANPTKYKINDKITLQPGQFYIFWADGGNWWAHTNFKLSSEGELIALFDSDTNLVDMITYGTLLPDISYGRNNEGNNNWAFFDTPTPNQPNLTKCYSEQLFSAPPTFSISGGFYSGIQEIMINSVSGSEIRFTTDGSVPDENSTLYTTAISFDTTTLLRARTFEVGKFPSAIVTNTYFINMKQNLPVVSIVTSPHFLFENVTGIYANSLKDIEIPANFEYIDTNGYSGINQLIGIELSGQVAYKLPQKMFNLSAKKKYGTSSLNYKFFNSRENTSFSTLILRNSGFPDNSSTLFRDALMQQLIVNELDLDYQDYQPVVLYLNGKYWGIYNLREKHSEEYLAANNNADPNNIDMLENYWEEVICGDTVRYNAFINYLKNCDIDETETSEYIKTQIDYDNYLNYQITQIYYANTDWPGNNYRYWRPRSFNGKWRWLLYDVEFGFGLISGYNDNTLAFVTDTVGQNWANPPAATWFFRRMLQNNEFKNNFIQRSAVLTNITFKPERIVNIIDSLQDLIAIEMPDHINRWKDSCWVSEWGQPYCGISSMNFWNTEVDVLREFAVKRPNYIYHNIMQYFNIPDTFKLQVISNHGTVKLTGFILPTDSFELSLFDSIPFIAEAIPDLGYHFTGWSGASTSNENNISLTLTTDTFLIANFSPDSILYIPSPIDTIIELTSTIAPYYAMGDIIIDSNAVLLIGPGVEIRMPDDACFIVYGQLITNGSEELPVRIKANSSIGANKWGAICVYNSTDTTILQNTVLSECSHGHDLNMFKGAVSAFNSSVIMNNVTISDAQQPFFSQGGDYIEIVNCKLRSDLQCDIMNIKRAKSCLVEGCDILGNEFYDTDGIDLDGIIDSAFVQNNFISGFLGINNDGIDIGEEANNIRIINNKIFNCFDKGISIGQASSVYVKNNTIVNCQIGIAVKDSNSYAYVDRNTFYNCNYGVSCYEKNLGHGGGQADVVNTIFSDCQIDNFSIDNLSSININYSLSNTKSINGTGNLYTEPMFTDEQSYNFSLKTGSPCINAGDPISPLDTDGSIADIGALFTSASEDSINQNIIINEINYNSPSWADAGDWIELLNNNSFPVDVSGWVFKDKDNIHNFYLPKGCIIPSEGYLVLCNDHYLFSQIHPGVTNFLYDFEFGLSSNGENVRLFNNKMVLIDSVRYSNQFPWPVSPDGGGQTLSLISPILDNGIASSWDASIDYFGTPGAPNEFTEIPTEDYQHSNEISMFPNPTHGLINLSGTTDQDNLEIIVFDLTGKILYKENRFIAGKWLIQIDFSKFATGLYSVSIRSINSTWHGKFILVN